MRSQATLLSSAGPVQLREDSLFSLISQRPFTILNHAEQNLWNVLENQASVGALRASLGDSAEEGIRRLLALDVAELVPPAPVGKRRRVMVMSTAYGRCGIKCWRADVAAARQSANSHRDDGHPERG